MRSLSRQDTVAEGGELLHRRESEDQFGDPPLIQAHEPFHERRCRPRAAALVQDRESRGGPSGDAFPSCDGCGVASPASKNSSISANVISDDGRCTSFVTRSMIKRSGDIRAFGTDQFVNSIGMALVGRHELKVRAALVAAWVLMTLGGQRRVLTSQLSAAVTATLRRVDDIAYLRWATIAKKFTSVREIANEAHDLVVAPSVRLVFDSRAVPRALLPSAA